MARTVDLGVTTYWWVPGDTGIANVSAPTVTELTAPGVLNITQYVLTTSTAGPVASETVSERSVADVANVVVPTIGNYEGMLNLFRDYADGAPTEDDLLPTFRDKALGHLVKRVGKPSTAPPAATDSLAFAGKYMADNVQVGGGTGEGYLKLTVPLLQQGVFDVGIEIAAAA